MGRRNSLRDPVDPADFKAYIAILDAACEAQRAVSESMPGTRGVVTMKRGSKDNLPLRTAALARTTRQLAAVVQDEHLATAMHITAVVAMDTHDERLGSAVDELIEVAAAARERAPRSRLSTLGPAKS